MLEIHWLIFFFLFFIALAGCSKELSSGFSPITSCLLDEQKKFKVVVMQVNNCNDTLSLFSNIE